jgi:Tfp pilus assembly protein PilV
MRKITGFTLVEVLVGGAILVMTVLGSLEVFNRSLNSSNFAKNQYIYLNEARGQMDQLLYKAGKDFGSLLDDEGKVFLTSSSDASGKIYVSNLHTGTSSATTCLLKVKVVVCWRQGNRVIGEDKDLDGVLDDGEDSNNNDQIDSVCQLETALARK